VPANGRPVDGRKVPDGRKAPADRDGSAVALRSHRNGLVGRLLGEVIAARAADAGRPTVLDCGGGSGTFAVPLARAGAAVTVVDISVDALATLARRAAEAGVADLVTPVQGDAESLDDAGLGSFDLVLAHGILEAVDRPDVAFAGIAARAAAGGVVSVLVDNPAASVLARALAGELDAAARELDALDSPTPPIDLAHVRRLCAQAGLTVEQVHGVGVFSDLVPGAALDLPGARDALADLDARCATRTPFAEIAGRVHVLARRPG